MSRSAQVTAASEFRGAERTGPSGAYVNGRFGLIIDGQAVGEYLEFYPGYPHIVWSLSAIVCAEGSLLECGPATLMEKFGEPDPSTDVICRDVPQRLRKVVDQSPGPTH